MVPPTRAAAVSSIRDRIQGAYVGLSEKLRVAADFVLDNPVDVATHSLRHVARSSGVSPATLSRLARALGYDDYEQMRDEGRLEIGSRMGSFSERAHALRARAGSRDDERLLNDQSVACMVNIEALNDSVTARRLSAAADALHEARSVLLVGSMGSSGLIDYLGYMAQWFNANWKVAGRNGVELSATLSRLGPGDVVLALTKTPYAHRTVAALRAARDRRVQTVAITDGRASPVLPYADHGFVVSTDSPQFFPSYAATLVLMETLVSLLLTRAGSEAEERIRIAESQVADLGENWTPPASRTDTPGRDRS